MLNILMLAADCRLAGCTLPGGCSPFSFPSDRLKYTPVGWLAQVLLQRFRNLSYEGRF